MVNDLAKLAVETSLEMMKTEDGRKTLSSILAPILKICKPTVCQHDFNRLLWIDNKSAVCLSCGIKLKRK